MGGKISYIQNSPIESHELKLSKLKLPKKKKTKIEKKGILGKEEKWWYYQDNTSIKGLYH